MLNDFLDRAQARGQAWFYGVSLGGGSLLLIFTFWLWWHYFYLNPQNVFWSAVNNNLIISGVTKQTESSNDSESLKLSEQISLGAENVVMSVSTTTQQSPKSTVVTETIGTPKANFARYTKIETNQKNTAGQTPDFSPVLSKWSKSEVGENSGGAFATAIFDALPFAHLNAQQRKQVVETMQNEQIYDIDFSKVAKERSGKGRLYYIYDVSIAGDKYISLLKKVDGVMGLNQLQQLDPTQYQGGAPVALKVKIDAVSHQLASLTYVDNNRTTTYTAWGAPAQITIPDKSIDQTELQGQLNSILGSQ